MTDSFIRVLLVEDSSSDARIIERALRRYPLARFEIDTATSTLECIERMTEATPDVILLDNGLPGESGISFLNRQQAEENMPPVIMLTGQGDERLALEAISLGAYDYHPKDAISSEILGRAVHSAIQRFRLDTALRQRSEVLRQSEERYRSLVELSPDAYFLVCSGRLVFLNSAGARLLRDTRPKEAVEGQVIDRWRTDQEEAITSLLQAVQGSEAKTFITSKFVTAGGEEIDVEVAAIPTIYQDEQAVQMVVRDITERKKAEKMTLRALAAEESEQQKVVLLSAVSHELKTPIAAIEGYATTILEYGDRLEKAEVREYLEGITQAARALDKLVMDLLTLSRLEAGALPLHRESFDFGPFLENVLATYRTRRSAHTMQVVLPPQNVMLHADAHRVRQVVNNLIDNALKYSPEDQLVRIGVELLHSEAIITVRDGGPGVSPEELEVIFEPFHRANNAIATEIKGTGLGLSICKAIVEAHGGRIWANLPHGGGFAVSMRLPRASGGNVPSNLL